MRQRRVKAWYFSLAALNTIATQYYLNYLFFFLRDRFGFTSRDNLGVAAFHGGLYIFAAWQGGRFAERRGYQTSLLVGFAGLAICMAAGGLVPTATGQLIVLAGFTSVLLFTWPALEALTVQHEPPSRVPHMVGVYNCTWSGAAAFAYFTGGALYDWLGAGAIFWLPAALCAIQFAITMRILDPPLAEAADANSSIGRLAPPSRIQTADHDLAAALPIEHSAGRLPRETFLRLAWLANPFSYVAVYTLLAIMPALGQRLGLSPARTGLFCSVWFFGRLAAFALLWQWTGWHYRFRWLAGGYVLLIVSFAAILLATSLGMVEVAQIGFGIAAGLMYSSSIFYSLDAGEAKAEHGGLHEAAIGAGIFAGPALGALSLSWFPTVPQASAIAVSALLFGGLVALVTIWARARLRAAH